MVISLVGYMGSGKSHISKLLSEKLGLQLFDLDREISGRKRMSIEEIFNKKGELYFRKAEREILEEILATQKNIILSLGGGTPAYFNNMEVINSNSISIYLQANIPQLAARLKNQKSRRPLIAHVHDDQLAEFIAKHLFERIPYYSKAQHSVDTVNKEPDEIADEIIGLLQNHY